MLPLGESMRCVGALVQMLRERWQSGVSFNSLSSRTAQDPYPVNAALRTRDPVHRSRMLNAWLVTRHRDVDAILRDHRHFGNDPRTGTLTARQHGMLALLRHPEQLERLRNDPSLIPAAVEELLRFDSPVQADLRRVLADCEVNGFALRKRDNVVLLLGAANRDPEVFVDPERLDVGRRQGAHLSFGRGIHHCLGAALARLEGRIVLGMLLERFPRMGLLGQRPRFRKGLVLRGLQSLPVRCAGPWPAIRRPDAGGRNGRRRAPKSSGVPQAKARS